jgi:DNA-binding transcriptional LysR family regulator
MQVKALAREIGVPILRPRGRRLEATSSGRTLSEYADRILGLADDASTAAALSHGHEVLVRVAASSTPGVNLLPQRIAAHHRDHPGCRVRLEVLNTEEVEERVVSGRADIGVVGGRLRNPGLRAQPWVEDTLVLVVPPDHRLARRHSVRARELAGEALLTRELGSAPRATVEAAFLAAGAALPLAQAIGGTDAIKSAVASGLGVAFVSRWAVETEARAGTLAVLRVRDVALERPLQILTDPARRRGKEAESFLRSLLDAARSIRSPRHAGGVSRRGRGSR